MNLLTIVTVNLNNKLGLQKTLKSIKSQNKKKTRFEFIVIDGGSTDGSIDVIKKNLKMIDYYVSEKDKNLYDAMNKGIKYANNKFIIFINSGETLFSKNSIKQILLKLTSENNHIFRFYVHGYGHVWRSAKNSICHESVAFVNKKKIFYDIKKSPFADGDYIKLNFERYGKRFHNLYFLNFNLGGVSNNFKIYQSNYSLFNKIKFLIFKLIGPKFYASISYKIKNYKKIK
jgi:glycosyltransferase involved in cell wall biosynthesis